jgi:hypothetical protein
VKDYLPTPGSWVGGKQTTGFWSGRGSLGAESQVPLTVDGLPGPSRGSGKMGKYAVRVATGDTLLASSSNQVQLWLVGEHREADLGKLQPLLPGKVSADCGRAARDGDLVLRGCPGSPVSAKPQPREAQGSNGGAPKSVT